MARPNIFQQNQQTRVKLNKFDLSHDKKFSLNMGTLNVMFVQDVLPGDKFRVNTEIMMRFAPMLAPVMHRINVRTDYFFIPNRIIWPEFEDFITGGKDGTSAPVAPYFNINTANSATYGNQINGFGKGSLYDFMGGAIVTDDPVTDVIKISALPFRAFQKCYDDFYRDQNLENEINCSTASGEVTGAELTKLLTQRKRAWEKDRYTSCLPWAQRGPEVLMPIEGEGSVVYSEVAQAFKQNLPNVGANGAVTLGASVSPPVSGVFKDSAASSLRIENIDSVEFQNTTVTINQLRTSVAIQTWLERNARGGARYIEQIYSHFGVISSDARLQRPEYLGGGKQPCVISEVLSTFQAETDGATIPQGNMAGHGVSVGGTNRFARRFEEHGYVIGIMSVLPRTAYMQGVANHLQKFDKFDYAWPEMAHLGEAAVQLGELYYDQSAPLNNSKKTFGYQSRYSEYKYSPSTVHGDMRDSLTYWHMAREFETEPALNSEFVISDPTTRIFNVLDPSVDHLYCQLFNRVDALRPLPYFGTPMLG